MDAELRCPTEETAWMTSIPCAWKWKALDAYLLGADVHLADAVVGDELAPDEGTRTGVGFGGDASGGVA